MHACHALRVSVPDRHPFFPRPSDVRIAGEHAEGKSLNAIAAAINAKGVLTATGAGWYTSTVAHVVRSVEIDNELVKVRQSAPH